MGSRWKGGGRKILYRARWDTSFLTIPLICITLMFVRLCQNIWSNGRRTFHSCKSYLSLAGRHLSCMYAVQVIALYTFIGVWMMKGISSMRITAFVVVGIWAFIAILAVVGLATHTNPSKPNLIGPTPVSTPYQIMLIEFSSEFMKVLVLG
jgi:hypothetical protein